MQKGKLLPCACSVDKWIGMPQYTPAAQASNKQHTFKLYINKSLSLSFSFHTTNTHTHTHTHTQFLFFLPHLFIHSSHSPFLYPTPLGVLESGHPGQAGGAEGCPDQKKLHPLPGLLQRIPGQTGSQEEKGKSLLGCFGLKPVYKWTNNKPQQT